MLITVIFLPPPTPYLELSVTVNWLTRLELNTRLTNQDYFLFVAVQIVLQVGSVSSIPRPLRYSIVMECAREDKKTRIIIVMSPSLPCAIQGYDHSHYNG